ncbi:hypothetical protein CSA80_04235 [Candidatus Saccharibacteria bacterium]|nr:MAG: hypothetical protein CR973_01690 [Candidatus Saccharibacteria bacterium]PID98880.1 MAG: hypothetical protein CSA80_04235 [Candidatus Saccharibacteria bacterium]
MTTCTEKRANDTMTVMRRILCYGDSNTWGNSAFSQGRIPFERQWPNILQAKLGDSYRIIQEGMPGRIAGDLQTDEAWYNGRDVFRSLVVSHNPLDLVIVALGTNDLKKCYGRSAEQIAADVMWYASALPTISEQAAPPQLLLVAPVRFHSTPGYFEAQDHLYDEVVARLQHHPAVLHASDIELSQDGVHFSYAGHQAFADAVEQRVRGLLPQNDGEKA